MTSFRLVRHVTTAALIILTVLSLIPASPAMASGSANGAVTAERLGAACREAPLHVRPF